MDQMIISYGLRIMSSCLSKEGHNVRIIFARAIIGRTLPDSVQNQILKLSKTSDIIGISLMSNHYPHAVKLTKYLKDNIKVPVIWGGVHPTFCPEESLKHADYVCVGEGEIAAVEMAKRLKRKGDLSNIPGIWTKRNDSIIKNAPQPLVGNLDELPLPDFGPERHFIRDGKKIKKMTNNLFKKYLTKRETKNKKYVAEYYISTSRGCPFRCAYCASNTIKNLYPKEKFFRLRSEKKVIEEVEYLIRKYNFIKWIYFADDDLLASPRERINNFCLLWKKRINLPFYATLAPWSFNEDKLKMFMKAGLGVINMGIQTVSDKGSKIYHRMVPSERLKEIIGIIHKLNLPQPPLYDFILDNPYENDNDRLENLDFILAIPKPRKFQLFSLIPFPGSEIYIKMKNDGLLKKEEKMIYEKSYSYPEATYINMLTFLANTNFPTMLIKILRTNSFLLLFNNRFAKTIFKLIPYSLFLSIARGAINLRFWRFNATTKGEF